MFVPPRCPNPLCPAHTEPKPGFCKRAGSYHPKCRPHPVQRYRCKSCRRSFSRQTFRLDYRDHKPYLNAEVVSRLASGVGLRQTARELPLSLWGLQKKFRKLARHLCALHDNLLAPASVPVAFALDEAESFEGNRTIRPVTIAFVIEQQTMFVAGVGVGTLPPRGRRTPSEQRTIAADRAKHGPRLNESRRAVAEALVGAARLVGKQASIEVRSDRKTSYPRLIDKAFRRADGSRSPAIEHVRVSSTEPRDTSNPLHRINLTLAMARDLNGRLRRRSWLHSKQRRFLSLQLGIFACYRNYVRVRFNGEKATPAQLLGLMPEPLTIEQLLAWRQDWGRERSVHPLARHGESAMEWRVLAAEGAVAGAAGTAAG